MVRWRSYQFVAVRKPLNESSSLSPLRSGGSSSPAFTCLIHRLLRQCKMMRCGFRINMRCSDASPAVTSSHRFPRADMLDGTDRLPAPSPPILRSRLHHGKFSASLGKPTIPKCAPPCRHSRRYSGSERDSFMQLTGRCSLAAHCEACAGSSCQQRDAVIETLAAPSLPQRLPYPSVPAPLAFPSSRWRRYIH